MRKREVVRARAGLYAVCSVLNIVFKLHESVSLDVLEVSDEQGGC